MRGEPLHESAAWDEFVPVQAYKEARPGTSQWVWWKAQTGEQRVPMPKESDFRKGFVPAAEGLDQGAHGGPGIVLALGEGAGEDAGVAGLGGLEGAVEGVLHGVGGEGGPGFAGVEPEEAG